MSTKTTITVLVVEDDSTARDVYSLVLQTEGYSVICAENGQHALDLMKGRQVDLIVTDLLMPVMDGLDFATKVKADMHYAAIPIILLSGTDLKEQARDSEVFSALLRKPCSADDLIATLAMVLEKTAQ